MENQLTQLQSESNKNYELLCKFISSGSDRNISKFAESVSLSRQQIHNIANQNDWKNRISEFERQSLNNLKLETISKFKALQKQEIKKSLETYYTLQKTLELANNSIRDLSIDEIGCEKTLNITSKYLNVLLKCNRMLKIIEEKLNGFGFDEIHYNDSYIKEEPAPQKHYKKDSKVDTEQRTPTLDKQKELKTLESELSEILKELENKSKLKAMGHRKAQKLYKKRNELRQKISDYL